MFRQNYEGPLTLVFRLRGQVTKREFSGSVYILGEDLSALTHVPHEELGARLDLTGCPVIVIGGRGRHKAQRLKAFLTKNPGFQGAFFLTPGTGNLDLDSGDIIVTSREILEGQRISGGRPEEQWINHRFLPDGRYAADFCKVLHGKTLEVLEREVEQDATPELIADQLLGWSSIEHPAKTALQETARLLVELENRRVRLSGETQRDMVALVKAALVAKLTAANVKRFAQIPTDLTVTPGEIDAELIASRETLGTIEIPGLGSVPLAASKTRHGNHPYVEVGINEARRITSWPHTTIDLKVAELTHATYQWDGSHWSSPLFQEGDDRWPLIRKVIADEWLQVQKANSWPKDLLLGHPQEINPPEDLPEPIRWGESLDGHPLMAYPAYTAGAAVERKPTSTYGYGHPGYERGWGIKWFASAMEAATHDAESRQAAVTFVRTRKTLVELTEDLPLAELPAQPPVEAPFAPTLAEAMGWLGFTPEQFQVAETPGPRVEVVRGTSYYSELREDWRQIEPDREVFHWFERENEIIVLYHNLTVDQLIGGRWERNALPVARKFASPEVIEEARTVRERLRQKHEDGQRAERRRFLEAVREHSVFPCLPIGLQGDIEKMLESLNNGFLSIAKLAQEIAEQWATAARLLERQRRGEICVNFGGILHVSGVSGDARFFVIQADGELRAPETGSFSKSHGRGAQTQVWSLVGPDELAIAWKGHRARVSQGDFRVSKLPVDGLSPAQIEAVRRIEEELRAIPNSFGLDPKLSDEQGLAMEAVRTAYHEVTSQGLPEDVRYRHVVDSGFDCTAHVESWMEREIDRTESFDRQIAGREAQAVWEIECAGGVLEFLAFHKFGHWNFSCRWRTLDAEEI